MPSIPAVPCVRLQSVSFSHTSSLPILVDVSLDLHPGWTALVGPNGAGKTTLLRLIAGELTPDDGHISLHPRNAVQRWCHQTAESCTREIRAFAEATHGEARRWQGRLDLDPHALHRWPTLSPGERRRWQVGAALADRPEVLLLDEPTDHLDADARERLVAALRRFEGVGLVVSHDRTLLGALATATARVHHGGVELRNTDFEGAREGWRLENDERKRARQKIVREERRLRRRLGSKRADLRSAESQVRTNKRAKGRRDSDQRTMASRNRARSGAARIGRDVATLRDQVRRTHDDLEGVRFDKERGGRVEWLFEAAPHDSIAHISSRGLEVGGERLLSDVSLEVRRSTRAWIRGGNGAGKSTLLRALLASVKLPAERILFLPQELATEAVDAELARVRALRDDHRGQLLAVCGALGADPDRMLATARPSPGEARKLAIALGLSRGASAVFLDEPTNHLDLPAIERLETALVAYPGALVVVSHDEPLARGCATECWEVAGGRVRVSSL